MTVHRMRPSEIRALVDEWSGMRTWRGMHHVRTGTPNAVFWGYWERNRSILAANGIDVTKHDDKWVAIHHVDAKFNDDSSWQQKRPAETI